MDRREIKALWREHGGSQHGPIVEHYSIEEEAFYRFVHDLSERHRFEAEQCVVEWLRAVDWCSESKAYAVAFADAIQSGQHRRGE